MKKILFIASVLLLLAACKKEENPVNKVAKETPKHVLKSASCDFYTQGIHSKAEFYDLVDESVSPIDLMSSTDIDFFADHLVFGGDYPYNVVIGFYQWDDNFSLEYEDYCDLVKLVVGINPDFDVFEDPDEDNTLPTIPCLNDKAPNPPSYNPPCTNYSQNDVCCYSKLGYIASNCD